MIERDSKPFGLGIRRKIFLVGLAMVITSFCALSVILGSNDVESFND